MTTIPHVVPGARPHGLGSPGDRPATHARFASTIRTAITPECQVALLGMPDDLGVRLNHGRGGANIGPTAFREVLASYGVAQPKEWSWPIVVDAGDVTPASGDSVQALAETHRRVSDAARALVQAGLFPVAIGGGHDLTCAFVRGVVEGRKALGEKVPASGVYFDAHLDVRETPGSGMGMRTLVEECGITKLFCRGFNEFANSAQYVEWFQTLGGKGAGRIVANPTGPKKYETGTDYPFPATEADGLPMNDYFLSIDLDVLDASDAPGVSALNPSGWRVSDLEPWIEAAGREKGLACFDIMELNPSFDDQGRTARIAAHLFLTLLKGMGRSGRFR
jgi:formiminoglutamase